MGWVMRPLWGLARQKPRRCAPGRLACHVAVADRAGRQVELSWTSPSPPRCPASPRCWWASTSWEPDLGSVLGAVHGSILNRPQGAQRRLLRLGHSPDPRDIEALIGPVASQRAEMLATLQVPERDGPIIPATGQRAAIGTHLERLDGPLMRFSHPHALPAVDIPHEELPALFATTTGGQPHPIGAPGHARDGPVMPHQPQELQAIRGVPQVDVAIIAPADHPRAIGAPGHATDPGCVGLPDPTAAACCYIPHLHSTLRGAAGQQLPV